MKTNLPLHVSVQYLVCVGLLACGGVAKSDWQLGPFTRPIDRPVIAPRAETVFSCPMLGRDIHWESSDTFNPAAVVYQDQIYVLYRAEDGTGDGIGKHTSRLGLAKSPDGITFERLPVPVFYPDNDSAKPYEWRGGCEDPRIVEGPDGVFYMHYTMWNRDNPDGTPRAARIGAASSKDLVRWTKHGPIFKNAANGRFLNDWHKAAAVVTKIDRGRLVAAKINGKFWMYWGEASIHAAVSNDLIHWEPVLDEKGNLRTLIRPRKDKFDSLLTEAGPPAVVTDKGIVLIYNGKNSGADKTLAAGAYAAGQLLLDAEDPLRVVERGDACFFRPERDFEKTGQYKDGTVFAEGLVYFKGTWFLYYGTADSFVGVASCKNP